jgi:hypothetical protein
VRRAMRLAAITSVDLSAGNLFDDVSSAFTVTLCQLGAATSLTTTTGALTAAREIPLTSATGLAAGDYLKVTSGGTPTRVLAVNGLIALVADDQTATFGCCNLPVFRQPSDCIGTQHQLKRLERHTNGCCLRTITACFERPAMVIPRWWRIQMSFQ